MNITVSVSELEVFHWKFAYVESVHVRGFARYLGWTAAFERNGLVRITIQVNDPSLPNWAAGYLAGTSPAFNTMSSNASVQKYCVKKPPQCNAFLTLFSKILRVDLTHFPDHLEMTEIASLSLREGFARLSQLCVFDPLLIVLATRFQNRTILPGVFLRQTLTLLDAPLVAFMDAMDPTLLSENVLLQSAFACTLQSNVLEEFWSKHLLLSGPQVLVQVTALVLIEVRSLILGSETITDVKDAMYTVGETCAMSAIIEIAEQMELENSPT